MPPSSSSSLVLLLLLLPPLLHARCAGFRSGQDDFVLDTSDAVKEGAVLLATAHALSAEDCERVCCEDARCNLALLDPRDPATGDRTCVLFDCEYRNQFVCRFVNQVGYQSYIRQEVFLRYLQGPQGPDNKAPPIAIAGRDVITQPGETVTLNGIESLARGDAHITEYRWSQVGEAGDISMEKTDLPDQVQLSSLQPGSYVFQLTVTDSNHQSHADELTVLVLSPELSILYCLAPVKVGPCRAAFPRWHYDAATGGCQQFVFGGCKQNHNNFLSEHECLLACKGVTATAERSAALPAGEVCGVACRPDQMICSNGCCLDRSLECDGKNHCEDASDEDSCSKLNQTFTHLLDIDVNQKEAHCSEPPHTGPCRASHSRWYYDPLDTRCYRFTFGGCEANDNNFQDETTCSEACAGVNESSVYFREMFERFKREEESDSGNIALAVLLSVAILALLAILTYCFLKSRKKRSHRPVSTGPAHVALSEQDTLVYNSTTKPL